MELHGQACQVSHWDWEWESSDMRSFKHFISETATSSATNSVGTDGFSNDSNPSGPVAGFDKKLFKGDEDLLSQDYQTAAETGENRYRFSNIYPVMKVTLGNNMGDGPSIDSMVAASKEFVNKMEQTSHDTVKKYFTEFKEEWSNKYKKSIDCSNPKGFSQKAHCAGRKKRSK